MIFLDIETTGVDPLKNGICSIGAIDFNNPVNTFYEEPRVEKGSEIIDFSLEYNGFEKYEILCSNRRSLEHVLHDFISWSKEIHNRTLSGHNLGGFDVQFMKNAFKNYNLDWIFGHRYVDLFSEGISYCLRNDIEIPLKDGRYDLDSDLIHELAGIPPEPKPHHAMKGAKWEAESYSRLVFGKNLLKEFEEYTLPEMVA